MHLTSYSSLDTLSQHYTDTYLNDLSSIKLSKVQTSCPGHTVSNCRAQIHDAIPLLCLCGLTPKRMGQAKLSVCISP